MKTAKERYDKALIIIGRLTTDDIKPKPMIAVLYAIEIASGIRESKISEEHLDYNTD